MALAKTEVVLRRMMSESRRSCVEGRWNHRVVVEDHLLGDDNLEVSVRRCRNLLGCSFEDLMHSDSSEDDVQ